MDSVQRYSKTFGLTRFRSRVPAPTAKMGAAYEKGPRSKLMEDLKQCLPTTLADRSLRGALATAWSKDRLRDFNPEEQGPTSGSRTTSSSSTTSRGGPLERGGPLRGRSSTPTMGTSVTRRPGRPIERGPAGLRQPVP